MSYKRELATAIAAADQAGILQHTFVHNHLAAELKDDRSPVTEVDRKCEILIRETLLSKFPSDGFMGEESGTFAGQSGRRWIVDPPAMKITCWAAAGDGAFLNGKPIHVSTVRSIKAAMGTAMGYVEKAAEAAGAKLFALMRTWDYAYGFMDAYSYVCVASGRLDLAVNILDKPWDCASAACIVREAGGAFSDIAGVQTVHNGSIVLSNGLLHDAALAFFKDKTPSSRE